MLLKRLIDGVSRGLSRKKSGIVLLSGVAGVLAGVERFIAPRPAPRPTARKPRVDYFSIRQTRSELGYTFWVLQGHGHFASFTLFDTWREAMDEADLRVGRNRSSRRDAHVRHRLQRQNSPNSNQLDVFELSFAEERTR
jgi:hypothetical protein